MPEGDITLPVTDLTGYITEGHLVLPAQRHAIYPPIDPLSSLGADLPKTFRTPGGR